MSEKKKNLPQDIYQEHKVIPHRLYKLRVAQGTRNDGISKDAPVWVKIEHCHFFHSHNDRTGMANPRCTAQSSHFHEVKLFWDKDQVKETLIDVHREQGRETTSEREYTGPQFECGPPLKYKDVKVGNKMVRRITPVQWTIEDIDGTKNVIDDHTHFVEYLYREDITPFKTQARQDQDKAKIGPHVSYQQVSNQIDKLQQLQNSGAKAADLGVE